LDNPSGVAAAGWANDKTDELAGKIIDRHFTFF
jgi:predicted RNase H-like nuclease (RuvC/YqgF family)